MFITSNQNYNDLPNSLGLLKLTGFLIAFILLYLFELVFVQSFIKIFLSFYYPTIDFNQSIGLNFSLTTLFTNGIMLLVSLLSLKLIFGIQLKTYFSMNKFTVILFLKGLLGLGLLYLSFTCIIWLFHMPWIHPFVRQVYQTAHSYSLLILALIVAAPLFEEVIFRGIIFHELSEKWGVGIASFSNAFIWALIHLQYEWIYTVLIFLIGIFLSLVYHHSKSLLLPIILHAIWNGISLLEAFILIR